LALPSSDTTPKIVKSVVQDSFKIRPKFMKPVVIGCNELITNADLKKELLKIGFNDVL